jgi:CheY-like chemotaxis protein
MVIDDSQLELYLIQHLVKKTHFAKEIKSFQSSPAAIEYLRSLGNDPSKFPEVLFLDIYMPLMTGFQFLDEFLEFPEAIKKRCKIVVFSSTNSIEDRAQMRRYPIIRKFLPKPLSPEMFTNMERLE